MNQDLLPSQFALYSDDEIPTNQRNLTDVRGRIAILLEYELGKVISASLGQIGREITLTYVIANRFPDLAFRRRDGKLGVRFEVKAIEAIAEEKSANFDTLLKDIRKGTDFVVAMLWEWTEQTGQGVRYPKIHQIFCFDAYELALLRDAYWLNTPPKTLGNGRQGYDLCFGVNCNSGVYKKEEGNYGKIMRIFDESALKSLSPALSKSPTLQSYREFRTATITLGLATIAANIAAKFLGGSGNSMVIQGSFSHMVVAAKDDRELLIIGSDAMPNRKAAAVYMQRTNAEYALLMNEKFTWQVCDSRGAPLASGKKPATAYTWAAEYGAK